MSSTKHVGAGRVAIALLTTIIFLSLAACGGGSTTTGTSTGGSGGSTNATPMASDGSVSTSENVAVSGTLSAADTDGDTLTFSIVANPSNGTVSLTNAATGAFTYTPGSAFTGSDSFTFKATDSANNVSSTATESVTVNTNTTPTASNGSVSLTENTAASGTLAASDSDSDTLTFIIAAKPAHGIVSITNASAGAFLYIPASGYTGSDSFTFQAIDSSSNVSNTATESVTVNAGSGGGGNPVPSASSGAVSTTENTAVTGTLSASDTDSDTLTFVIVTNPAHGSASITNASTGAFKYIPASNYTGGDSFTFEAVDSASNVSNTATESVTVNAGGGGGGGGNATPTASNGSVSTTANTAKSGTLSATDSDHDALTFSVATNPSHGNVNITNASTGAFIYTPASDYAGSDSFTFQATDSSNNVSNTATESVTVNATVAGAPDLTATTPGSGSIELTFTAPSLDGGAAITSYKATCTASGNTTFTATGSASPITVTGMNGGVTRSCAVAAINSAGTGTASNALSDTPTSLAPEDLTKLPEGDNSSTTSVPTTTGLLMVCSVTSGGGASSKGPWFNADGTTWDETKKFAVQGSNTLSPYNFASSVSGGNLNASGNDYPSHPVGTYPIANSDPMHAYDGNPNSISATDFSYALSASPTVASTPTCTQGTIGFLVTGAKLFNAVDAGDRDAAAWEGQDACHGHPQSAGAYHYHNVPITNQGSCLPSSAQDVAGQHSPVVGYAADGFPIYGNLGENGVPLSNADLDICHGHTHSITFNGKTVVMYHYHATHSFPYTVGCYRGTPKHIQ